MPGHLLPAQQQGMTREQLCTMLQQFAKLAGLKKAMREPTASPPAELPMEDRAAPAAPEAGRLIIEGRLLSRPAWIDEEDESEEEDSPGPALGADHDEGAESD